jgi:DNA repair ATPase RecN
MVEKAKMRASIHPAIRRIVWLIIIIGAIATLIAAICFLFNLGPGITLPFTRTALDIGWLFVFGLMWLVVGLILLWWLRPVTGESDESNNVQQFEEQFMQSQMAQDAHLADIDARVKGFASQMDSLRSLSAHLSDVGKVVQGITARLEGLSDVSNRLHELERRSGGPPATVKDTPAHSDDAGEISQRLHDLDSEIDNLATTIQDAHRRIDNLGDVNGRLDDLESQLDALYVTLQDAHRRIDGLEQGNNR